MFFNADGVDGRRKKKEEAVLPGAKPASLSLEEGHIRGDAARGDVQDFSTPDSELPSTLLFTLVVVGSFQESKSTLDRRDDDKADDDRCDVVSATEASEEAMSKPSTPRRLSYSVRLLLSSRGLPSSACR